MKTIMGLDIPFLHERFGTMKAATEQQSRERYTWFTKRYALTPVQARIAAFIAEGGSVAGYAAANNSSPATVRTHLKAIFKKTRTTRQAELAALMIRRNTTL